MQRVCGCLARCREQILQCLEAAAAAGMDVPTRAAVGNKEREVRWLRSWEERTREEESGQQHEQQLHDGSSSPLPKPSTAVAEAECCSCGDCDPTAEVLLRLRWKAMSAPIWAIRTTTADKADDEGRCRQLTRRGRKSERTRWRARAKVPVVPARSGVPRFRFSSALRHEVAAKMLGKSHSIFPATWTWEINDSIAGVLGAIGGTAALFMFLSPT